MKGYLRKCIARVLFSLFCPWSDLHSMHSAVYIFWGAGYPGLVRLVTFWLCIIFGLGRPAVYKKDMICAVFLFIPTF